MQAIKKETLEDEIDPDNSVLLKGFMDGLSLLNYGAPDESLMLSGSEQIPDSKVNDFNNLDKELVRALMLFNTVARDIVFPLIRRIYPGYSITSANALDIKDIDSLLSFLWRVTISRRIVVASIGAGFSDFSVPLSDLSLYGLPDFSVDEEGEEYSQDPDDPESEEDLMDRWRSMPPGPDNPVFLKDLHSNLFMYQYESVEYMINGFLDIFLPVVSHIGVRQGVDSEKRKRGVDKKYVSDPFMLSLTDKKIRIKNYNKGMHRWTRASISSDHVACLGKISTLFGLLELAARDLVEIFAGTHYMRDINDKYKHAYLGKTKFSYLIYMIDYSSTRNEIDWLLGSLGNKLGAAVFLSSDVFLNDGIFRGAYINKKIFEEYLPLRPTYAYKRFEATHASESKRFSKMALRRCFDTINKCKAL
jgi:hypothetical protein